LQSKRKLCVVVNSRANYARIKSLLYFAKKNANLKLQLVVGASALLERYGNLKKILKKDGFKIDQISYTIVEGSETSTMSKSVGLGIIELTNIFQTLKPDIVLTIADRFENLAVAIASSYLNICLAHTQGGETTGSIDESVRHAITKLSHLHFPSTKRSNQFLINMGEDPKKIFNVGCPSMDIINFKNLKKKNFNLNKFGVGHIINIKNPYIVVLFHPDTTEILKLENQIDVLIKSVYEFSEENNCQVVWFWPNIDAGSDKISSYLRKFREKFPKQKIRFIVNLEPEDYLKVIHECKVIVGNSSSGIREASFMGIPSVNVGLRQNNREKYLNVKDSDFDVKKLKKIILLQFKKGRYKKSNLYGTGNAGKKIIDILGKVDLSIKKELNYLKRY
jgi:UDP-hydrolysing UDP-N-acetyl-D-glucosamine 2-epimerase